MACYTDPARRRDPKAKEITCARCMARGLQYLGDMKDGDHDIADTPCKKSFRASPRIAPRYPAGQPRGLTRRQILVTLAALSGLAVPALAGCDLGMGDTSGAPQMPDYRPPDGGDMGIDSTVDGGTDILAEDSSATDLESADTFVTGDASSRQRDTGSRR